MPSGKNSIPKMAILRQHLEEAGFEAVRTYIQSGNILLRSELSDRCLYVHAPVTYKNSRLTNNALERHLKVTCTTRNLNTLRRILALVTPDA